MRRPRRWRRRRAGTCIAEASEGGLVFDPDSRHFIQYDNPALVISAIRRVVFPSVQNALERMIKEKGVDAAIATYRLMKQRYPGEFMREPALNNLGYQQLRAKRAQDAIALFTLNVEMFPDGFNTYDSLAEAYVAQGDRDVAISNYRKSLALNPDNPGAVSALKALGATPWKWARSAQPRIEAVQGEFQNTEETASAIRHAQGGAHDVPLTERVVSAEPTLNLFALDRALESLAATDARNVPVVELRFFGGLSIEESADVLCVSTDTITRDWRLVTLRLIQEWQWPAQSTKATGDDA